MKKEKSPVFEVPNWAWNEKLVEMFGKVIFYKQISGIGKSKVFDENGKRQPKLDSMFDEFLVEDITKGSKVPFLIKPCYYAKKLVKIKMTIDENPYIFKVTEVKKKKVYLHNKLLGTIHANIADVGPSLRKGQTVSLKCIATDWDYNSGCADDCDLVTLLWTRKDDSSPAIKCNMPKHPKKK